MQATESGGIKSPLDDRVQMLWQYQPYTPGTNTAGAYQQLIDQDMDVILAAAISQSQKDAARTVGMELHLTLISWEAFAFFVNSQNPVESLTVKQVRASILEKLPTGMG